MKKPNVRFNAQILEEATSWFVDFNDEQVDQTGREEFNAWLRRSPEHVRAFLQISAFWEDAGALGKRSGLDLEGLSDAVRAESNVYSLELAASEQPAKAAFIPDVALDTKRENSTRRWRATSLRLSIAASILICLAFGASTWYRTYRAPSYATAVGEQRSIILDDGSSVELNSNSSVKVRFTKAERLVDLVQGQALFTVAKNPSRPFVVATGDTHVRAVGTRFDVYRKATGTVVTVVEGRVAVAAPAVIRDSEALSSKDQQKTGVEKQRAHGGEQTETPALHAKNDGPGLRQGEVLLDAGEQLQVSLTETAAPRSANVAMATAWTEKKLVFESASLREVVEEFNRYNRQQLIILDPELNDFHISGVFPSTDSGPMVEFLRQRFGVTLNRSRDRLEISRRERGENSAGAKLQDSASPEIAK